MKPLKRRARLLPASRPLAFLFLAAIVVVPIAIDATRHKMGVLFWVGLFNALTLPLVVARCSLPDEPYPDVLARAGWIGAHKPRGIGALVLPIIHLLFVLVALVSVFAGRDFARTVTRKLTELPDGRF